MPTSSLEMDDHLQLSDGRRLSYREYGRPDGAPVFFFHGWPGSRLDFAPNEWAATELAYDRSATLEPGADAAAKGCMPGSQTESGTATQAQPTPATTAAPTTAATETTGP